MNKSDKNNVWHKGVSTSKNDENINLCGRLGPAIFSENKRDLRHHVTCDKCREKLHFRKIKQMPKQESDLEILDEHFALPANQGALLASWTRFRNLVIKE